MPGSFAAFHGVRIYKVPRAGPALCSAGDAVDLMSAASERRAAWIAIPVERLPEDFFQLRTRIAGEIIQKFATYGAKVAIVGDISARLSESQSLAAWVAESNRGPDLWFVRSLTELGDRLGGSLIDSAQQD